MRSHRAIGIVSFLLLTALLVLLVLRVEYKEDISDFLPLDGSHDAELNVFQNISGADKIIVIFQYADPADTDADEITQAIDDFTERVAGTDTLRLIKAMTSEADLETAAEAMDFVYDNIPYFLTDEDYARIDSLLESEDYIREQLSRDKQMLMLPSVGLMASTISRDPLDLFSPAVKALQTGFASVNYEIYNGYIFSPDMTKAFVMVTTPFGASETENNALITKLLRRCAAITTASREGLEIHVTGAPVIAVENAQRIKDDSLLSVTCAMVLILVLLFISFRNVRNLLLIALSIGWGWLFGLGCLSLIHHSISVIVLGISSVVLGIAVNYPLHLIAHFSHTPDKRTAVREIVVPLIVGNITTVGAFLALVPLKSVAMRDLGLFSSFLLIGTILFVLIWLPHMASVRRIKGVARRSVRTAEVLPRSANRRSAYVVLTCIILTIVLGYYSLGTKFDANMANINYMTAEQKADMEYFQNVMRGEENGQKIYAVSSAATMDEVLAKNDTMQVVLRRMADEGKLNNISSCSRFLTSVEAQRHRLMLWNAFVAKRGDMIKHDLALRAEEQGFSSGAFSGFIDILNGSYNAEGSDFFASVIGSFYSGYISENKTGGYNVANVLDVDDDNVEAVVNELKEEGVHAFDIISMNSAIANTLSDDFNYIGWACGLIVFLFLWLSMGSLELAALSFLPMAISWVWILGLMAVFGIQFNIVNIILATFIFGQGDDYTIFMTEGASHEYAYRRKILGSYRSAILLSALIMFIGIGSLIVARHPALHSLAEVTIVGMLSVVLTAYILPPMIFGWLVRENIGYRARPLSLTPMLLMAGCLIVFLSELFIVYALGVILFVVLKRNNPRRAFFHRFVQRLYVFDFNHIRGVKFEIANEDGEDFTRPAIITSNHQSMLDAAIFMALTHRCIIVSNGRPATNPLVRQIYKWMDFVSLTGDTEKDLAVMKSFIADGYSIVVFPEGERNPASSILRFHKGAFYLAEKLDLDILPVILHGANFVLPRNSISVFSGRITVSVGKRIAAATKDCSYVEQTKMVHHYYINQYEALRKRIETTSYFRGFILDRYRYKGNEVFHSVAKRLRAYGCFTKWIDHKDDAKEIAVVDNGYGEFALLYALIHPLSKVTVAVTDDDKAAVLKYSAEGIVDNLCIVQTSIPLSGTGVTYLIEPKRKTMEEYADYNVEIIQKGEYEEKRQA